jgi:hypothetical protein
MLEVMDHAPATLTSGERLVLLVIAERASDKTRVAKQSSRWTIDTIAHRAGVTRSGLKTIFQGLAKEKCEVRVPVKTDKRGNPVFAFEGTAMTFKVPKFAKRGGQSIPSERGCQDITSGPQEGMPQRPRGDAVASERGCHSVPQSLSSTLKEPSNFSLSDDARSSVPAPRKPDSKDRERDGEALRSKPEHQPLPYRVLAAEGVDRDEADLLIPIIEAEKNVQGDGFWRHVAKNRDIVGIIAEARSILKNQAAGACENCFGAGKIASHTVGGYPTYVDCPICAPPSPDRIRAFVHQLVGFPACPHGHDGGNVPMPGIGWMSCEKCLDTSGYRSPRIVEKDEQPRSGQRDGYRAPEVNKAPGQRAASWARRGKHIESEPPPGHEWRADGSLVLVDTRDPRIDWDDFGRPQPEEVA